VKGNQMKEKWTTLEHNGVLFPKAYEYVGFDKNLSSLAEEMLYHYCFIAWGLL
jgi:hypothetical protein